MARASVRVKAIVANRLPFVASTALRLVNYPAPPLGTHANAAAGFPGAAFVPTYRPISCSR